MQDQGKRLLVAVALALGVMFAWNLLFPPKKDDPKKPVAGATGSGSGSGVVVPGTAPLAISQVGTAATGTVPAAGARGAEQKITLAYPAFTATFSSYGGVLQSWHLADTRYDHDLTKGELVPRPEKFPDTGALGVNFNRGSTYVLPAKAEWACSKTTETQVHCTLSTPELAVDKTFDVFPAAYLVRLTVKVTTTAPAATEQLAVTSFAYQDPAQAGGGSSRIQARVFESSTMRDGAIVATGVKVLIDEGARYEQNIQWTGFEHPYLLVGYSPKTGVGATADKQTFAERSGLIRTDILFQPRNVAGAPQVYEIDSYLGPKNYEQLGQADQLAGTSFQSAIDLGWFGFIGKRLMWLLLKFYSVLGNWGLSIILLTVLVKGLTIPLITKSMRSMKAMAVLGPQMKGLQAKYKDDKQRLQIETMALYKEYGVNPLSGCLPIFLQMPIWLALYRMLSSAGELYQQPFIPGWLDDLTAADPIYVLPVILMVTMFAQARLTPTNPDPSQRMQQRMMQYGMPLMFGVMSFFFPSGLTLYIFTNTILSALHSIYMNKFDKKSLAFAAQIAKVQAGVAADAPKGAKDANVKAGKSAALDKIVAAEDEGDDDEDDDDDKAAAAAAARNPRPAQARQKRRKKGRR